MCINIALSAHIVNGDFILSPSRFFFREFLDRRRRRPALVCDSNVPKVCCVFCSFFSGGIAKDKNIHNYTAKSGFFFLRRPVADSPRSKFKHFHFAVFFFRIKEEHRRATYVGGPRSDVICFGDLWVTELVLDVGCLCCEIFFFSASFHAMTFLAFSATSNEILVTLNFR